MTNTVFHATKLSLRYWFMVMNYLSESSKGVSSVQISKDLEIRQGTVWHILTRLRDLTNQENLKLSGVVEVDETFVRGKEKNKHASKKKGALTPKAPIIGIIERDTKKIKASHVQNTKAMTLKGYIYDNVAFGSSIMTDDNMVYRKINPCYNHKSVSHSMKEYVNGTCHTNNIENFWSLFKRGYIGIYHYMSKKHLQKYVNEYVFRYNNRDQKEKFSLLFNNLYKKTKTYKELVNA